MSYSIPFKRGDRIVELGGGETPFKVEGLETFNVDVRQIPGVDAVRDLEEDFTDIGQFDGLFTSYLAEHISWRKIEQFFVNCCKVVKNDGIALFIVPNTLEQFRKVSDQQRLTLSDSQFIFGNQDYKDNTHRTAFCKTLITEMLKNAGFNEVKITDHPDPNARDMIVEAYKNEVKVEVDKKSMQEMYDRAYFEDDTDGYVGFYDFPTHFNIVNTVLAMKPESVLDVGAARGYMVKHIEAHGIRATALDVSPHCWHTRATDDFVLHDVIETPWPFKDNEYDVLMSTAFLEHVPEQHLSAVMKEMARVSRRSYHTITFEITSHDIDTTHHQGTIKPHAWWMKKFEKEAPGYPVKIMTVEEAHIENKTPVSLPEGDGLLKVNFGSHICMFYYDWLNADITDLSQFATQTGRKFQQMDVLQSLPFSTDSMDYAVAHHLIEHFTHEEAMVFLRDCLRALKPGGILRLSAPDAQKISRVYAVNKMKETYSVVNVGVENAQTENEAFYRMLWDGHKMIVDEEFLVKMMEEAGFVNVLATPFCGSRSDVIRRQTIDSFPTISVYVEGEKPQSLDTTANITVEPKLEAYQKYLTGIIKEGFQ